MMPLKNAEIGLRFGFAGFRGLRAAGLRFAGGFFFAACGRLSATSGGLRFPDLLMTALPGVLFCPP